MAEKKDCTTCKFSDEKIYNEPCESCKSSDIMYSNYQPNDIQETPPDELDIEAKELYKRFYTEISEVLVMNNVAERRVSKITKQCAIIHCDLMYDKLTELLKSELHNDFGIMAERGRYIEFKNKIESL